jgi:predicted nuclease of predicted toxin-antitoxin system
MKLLLDENLPKKLKLDFFEHEVYSVVDKAWNGVSNGELLKLMVAENFEVFLTFDKNFQHQQNLKEFTVTVFVLSALSNTYDELTKLSSKILSFLLKKDLPTGIINIS